MQTPTNAELARCSNRELMDVITASAREIASLAAHVALHAGELDRREGWRDDGAVSLESWLVDHLGISKATARNYAHVAERLFDLPRLAEALGRGDVSLDKVRTVADTATPESDAELSVEAARLSVRDLADLARARRGRSAAQDRADHDRRSLRFNDLCRTMTAQLPASSYAEVRACLEERAVQVPSDGETPWDQRLADAFMQLVRGAGSDATGARSPYTVLAHVPLEVLTDPTSTLCGELDRIGLISSAAIRELACDATLIVAADDDAGHTMYEGRAFRFATETQRRELGRRDRHCRFPGCTNAMFLIPHHIEEWEPGGLTDLPNLAFLCPFHHHLIHSNTWEMSGDGNDELTFRGPGGDVLHSHPSPLWTVVTDPAILARRGRERSRGSGLDPGGA